MDDHHSRPRAFGTVIYNNCDNKMPTNKQSIVSDKMLSIKMTKKINNKNIKNSNCKISNENMNIDGIKSNLSKSGKTNSNKNSEALDTKTNKTKNKKVIETSKKSEAINAIKNEQTTKELDSNKMLKLLTTPRLSENFDQDTIYEYYYLKLKTTSDQLEEMNRKNDNLSKEIERLRNENAQLEQLTQEFEEIYDSLIENCQESE